MDEATLRAELRQLRDGLAWPQTPDFAGSLLTRLPDQTPRTRFHRVRVRRTVGTAVRAAAFALLLVSVSVAAVPEVRHALGIGGASITKVDRLPVVAPRHRLPLGPAV